MSTYTATFSAVAASAAQDVFELVAPSTSRVAIHSISLGKYSEAGEAAAELLSVLIMRGQTTSGSGPRPGIEARATDADPAGVGTRGGG